MCINSNIIKMRLIQFTASNVWRGHEQKIIYLYEAFHDLGYVEDQWIVCRENSEIHKVAIQKKMNVITLSSTSKNALRLAKQFKKISSSLNADIIFIHNSKAHTIAVLSSFLFGLKLPLVLCRTLIKRVDTNFLRSWKYNYKGIKKILCITQPVVDELKFAVKDHNKLKIVGILTDVNKFTKKSKDGLLHKSFGISPDYKIIGNIAAFTGFKDHKTWVNVVEELIKRGNVKAKYILVGKGELEDEIKEIVKNKGLENEIIFAGFRRDIPEILPEFDLLLFTSNAEPAGGVILEAYACKVPVVAANAGGVPEVALHNQTALLAKAGDYIDFANNVEAIIGSDELKNKLTENGYQFLLENFTKEVIAQKMFEELKEVLQESKK